MLSFSGVMSNQQLKLFTTNTYCAALSHWIIDIIYFKMVWSDNNWTLHDVTVTPYIKTVLLKTVKSIIINQSEYGIVRKNIAKDLEPNLILPGYIKPLLVQPWLETVKTKITRPTMSRTGWFPIRSSPSSQHNSFDQVFNKKNNR